MEDEVIINCDWLQYSVMLSEDNPEFLCPEGYRIELLQGNNIFRYRALVFDGLGRKWLTLLWSPYSSVLNRRIMTVQVANFLLYYAGVNESYRLLKSIVDCHFNSCGRVDVCADFPMTVDKLETLRHLNSGHYYVQGKSEGSAWWHSVKERNDDREWNRNQFHCLSWGSKCSDIKVKCYHKSREINATEINGECEKPYIREQWKLAGWDISNVWRLEFSLSGTGKLQWKNEVIDLQKVSSSDWLRHVFYSLYGSRFVVRVNQGRRAGHKNLDQVRDFLLLPPEGDVLTRSLGVMDGKTCAESVKLLRKLMSQLNSPAVMSNMAICQSLVTSVATVVEQNGLTGYFLSKFGMPYVDYLQDVLDRAGEGLVEVDGDPRKAWM